MDDKERRMLSFQASATEVEVIDARAAKAGLSRSEYLRARAISGPETERKDLLEYLESLMTYAICQLYQTHVALYSIAEAAGKTRAFVTTEQLEEIHKRTRTDAIQFTAGLPERLAKVQAEIAAAATKEG